jgi:glycosyltransferase involved in cell wall biosynthesis
MKSSQNHHQTLCIGILAMNEAHRIDACIKSASFGNEIVLVDSGSRDKTSEIARSLGASVYLYDDWQGFAVQRNRLLKHVTSDYVFFLDADEIITPELKNEILNAVNSGQDAVWEIQWNQVAYGRPLRLMKSTGGIRRLFKVSNIVQFEGVVHEGAILRNAKTPIYRFKNRLLHYSRETIHGSLQKLAQYVQLGAAKRAALGKTGGIIRGLASALAIFFKLYILRRGILCGPEGFLFCFFIALECFFRYVALRYDTNKVLDRLERRS